MKKLVVSFIVFVLMLLPAIALAEVAWVPPTITPLCAPDAQSSAWKITLAQESNYNYQWADNAQFTGYTQVAGQKGDNLLTTPRIQRIWVRWASDTNSKSDSYWIPKGCAPEPPKESSSLSVEGECNADYVASYTIANGGGDMFGPSTWYQADTWTGGASSCAENVAAGYTLSGTFTLSASASIDILTTLTPGAICVAQRPWHPGVGWTHAAIETVCEPPPPPPCLNHPEWTEVPDGWEQLEDGECVEKPQEPIDQCDNIEGFQPPLPPNWYVLEDGTCVEDLCTNIDGIQTEVPEGTQEEDGICLEPTALQEWQEPGQFVQWRIFLPLITNAPPLSGDINFKVWRRCVSGQVFDRPAKNLVWTAQAPGLWVAGVTSVVGEATVNGVRFQMYLGTDRQESEEIYYSPDILLWELYYIDNGC